jgi:AraC-like DNA-binding protein
MVMEFLPRLRHESSALPRHERFDCWQSLIAGSFEDATGARSSDEVAEFSVESVMWNLGTGVLSSTKIHGRQIKQRSAQRIRCDFLDHYRIHVQRGGEEMWDADGRRSVVRPGNILFTDMSRAQRSEVHCSSRTVLTVPRELIDEALPRPMDLHGAVLGGDSAHLLGHHLNALADSADGVVAAEASLLMAATVQLVAGAVLASRDSRLDAAPAVEPSRMRQMCRYIDMNLADPALDAERLCANFNISRTSLYRLFGPLGGVNAFIRERRLQRVHEALRRSGTRMNLARLASDHGFVSASHFSRAFRDQYGISPSDIQRLGGFEQFAAPRSPSSQVSPDGAMDTLSLWLRTLRD